MGFHHSIRNWLTTALSMKVVQHEKIILYSFIQWRRQEGEWSRESITTFWRAEKEAYWKLTLIVIHRHLLLSRIWKRNHELFWSQGEEVVSLHTRWMHILTSMRRKISTIPGYRPNKMFQTMCCTLCTFQTPKCLPWPQDREPGQRIQCSTRHWRLVHKGIRQVCSSKYGRSQSV